MSAKSIIFFLNVYHVYPITANYTKGITMLQNCTVSKFRSGSVFRRYNVMGKKIFKKLKI